jgi:hypothetical protein
VGVAGIKSLGANHSTWQNGERERKDTIGDQLELSSPVERALVAALVSAILRELHAEVTTAKPHTAAQ